MQQWVGFVLALALVALPLTAGAREGREGVLKVPRGIRTQHRLPPRLMLRASYYLYLDMEATNGARYDQPKSNAEEPKSTRADDDVASPEPILDESVASPALGTEGPDIDTLSQRSIEHYEIHHETLGQKTSNRRRRRAIALGVTIPILVVGSALLIGGAVAVSNMEF